MAARAQTLMQEAKAKLSAEQQQTLRKMEWHDRLTSPWAPISVLGLLFLPYLTIVELATCTYLWLQPLMQGIALIAFAWWLVLTVLRQLPIEWNRRRIARAHVEELIGATEAAVRRHRTSVKAETREELVTLVARMLEVFSGPVKPLQDAYDKLDKHQALKKLSAGKFLDFGSGFAKALLIAILIRTVLLEPYKIPSGSMIPTLEIGDQIFVNKFIYGVRIPFTNYVPFTIVRKPVPGDIIVFNNPVHPEFDYIKRVIAVGGDTIEFNGARISVNGTELATRTAEMDFQHADKSADADQSIGDWFVQGVKHDWYQNDWRTEHQVLGYETLNGKQHYILHMGLEPRPSDGSVRVPEGHVFVMGDNRDHSQDSRFGLSPRQLDPKFAFVPLGHIKGKATVIWLPLGHNGWGASIFGATGFRFDRLFLPLTLCDAEPPRVK